MFHMARNGRTWNSIFRARSGVSNRWTGFSTGLECRTGLFEWNLLNTPAMHARDR